MPTRLDSCIAPLGETQAAFISDIGRNAHDLVDNTDWRAQRLRQKHTRGWKVFVLIDIHQRASKPFCKTARSARDKDR